MAKSLTTLTTIILLIHFSEQFSIPGVSTQKLKEGQQVQIFASDIGKFSLFDFFCQDQKTTAIRDSPIDQIFDDSIYLTQFKAYTKVNQYCRRLCYRNKTILSQEDISDEYSNFLTFSLHDLKAVYKGGNDLFSAGKKGIPLVTEGRGYPVANHFRFIIHYHDVVGSKSQEKFYKIVKIEVSTKSIAPKASNAWNKKHKMTYGCNYGENVYIIPTESHNLKNEEGIFFTYDVVWEKSENIKFGTVWDNQSNFDYDDLFVDSFIFTLVCAVLYLIIKTLINEFVKRKIKAAQVIKITKYLKEEETVGLTTYNVGDNEIKIQNNLWKFLAGDVFRPPRFELLFSITVGTGVQLCLVAFLASLLICLTFTHKDHRGNIILIAIISYLITSAISGWYSSLLYKSIGGNNWLLCAFGSSILFPALGIILLTLINFVLVISGSRFSLSTWEIIIIISIWLGIFLPQVFVGSFVGFKSNKIKFPCKVNVVKRTVKDQPVWLNKYTISVIGGLILVLFLMFQLTYLGKLFWSSSNIKIVPAFICIILGGIMTLVVSGEIGILTAFILILHGNHRWWWSSFLSCASAGIYCFIFSVTRFIEYKTVYSTTFFILINFLISAFFSFICGTVAFLSAMRFMKYIYSQIKIE